jgi:hypothetical protein
MTEHARQARKRRSLTKKERDMICALLRDMPEDTHPAPWKLADELQDSTTIIIESRK